MIGGTNPADDIADGAGRDEEAGGAFASGNTEGGGVTSSYGSAREQVLLAKLNSPLAGMGIHHGEDSAASFPPRYPMALARSTQ